MPTIEISEQDKRRYESGQTVCVKKAETHHYIAVGMRTGCTWFVRATRPLPTGHVNGGFSDVEASCIYAGVNERHRKGDFIRDLTDRLGYGYTITNVPTSRSHL